MTAITVLGSLAEILGLLDIKPSVEQALTSTPVLVSEQPASMYPNVQTMSAAAKAHVATTAPEAQLLEIIGDATSQQELDVFPYDTSPVFIGWRFLYRSSSNTHYGIELTVLDNGAFDAKSINLSESQARQRAINRLAIDIRQILEVADRNGAEFLAGSSFRLTMLNVNGVYRPVWYVPYRLRSGSKFVIDAATGQLLCQGKGQPDEWRICDVQQ